VKKANTWQQDMHCEGDDVRVNLIDSRDINSSICDSIEPEYIHHFLTEKTTASSTQILLKTHHKFAENHCSNRHLMQPLTSQPALALVTLNESVPAEQTAYTSIGIRRRYSKCCSRSMNQFL
jgi:hypothetical protein